MWTKPVAEIGPNDSAFDRPFDEMDHDVRIAFMKHRVLPTMAPMFQAHDSQRFAKFGCETCHGPGAREGEFIMPNDALPKIGKDATSKFDRSDIDFMLTEVKPTMARLLKQPEWSPANTAGFDCFGCHPRECSQVNPLHCELHARVGSPQQAIDTTEPPSWLDSFIRAATGGGIDAASLAPARAQHGVYESRTRGANRIRGRQLDLDRQ